MSETMGRDAGEPGPLGPGGEATTRAASGWKTFLQVALIVAAVLLVQRVLLPSLGIGT